MDGERLKCVEGECALPALHLGKGLSEQGTVIARNLLSTLTHSTIPFLGYEKELRENRDAKDTSSKRSKVFLAKFSTFLSFEA